MSILILLIIALSFLFVGSWVFYSIKNICIAIQQDCLEYKSSPKEYTLSILTYSLFGAVAGFIVVYFMF